MSCKTSVWAAAFAACGAAPYLPHRRTSMTTRSRELPEHPVIEVIIPAYLESSVIDQKVQQLRSQAPMVRITVACSDRETALASGRADKVLRLPRAGKSEAVNAAVAGSEADVVVLTDANCSIEPASWVCVMTESLKHWDLISANKREVDGPDRAYWTLERRAKSRAAEAVPSLAVVGEFLAFRRADFAPIRSDTLVDDLALALDFASRGLSTTVIPELSTWEEAAAPRDQWDRRVRIVQGQFELLIREHSALRSIPVGRDYLVRKFLRLSLGNLAFWGAVAAAPPRPRLFLGVAVTWSVARYSGRLLPDVPVTAPEMVVGVQAVPPCAVVKMLNARLRKSSRVGASEPGTWRKVAR